MTKDDALHELRSFLHDWAQAQHPDTILSVLVSLAQQLVAALTLSYERMAAWTDADNVVVAGRREYSLDGAFGLPDAWRVLQVFLDDAPLTHITVRQLPFLDRRVAQEPSPRYWYQWGTVLGVWPAFTTTGLQAFRLELVYAAIPPVWTAGESVLPTSVQHLIVPGAALLAKLREGKYTEMGALWAYWWGHVQAWYPLLGVQRVHAREELRLGR